MITLEEVGDSYSELLSEAVILLHDIREGNTSVKTAKQRSDLLGLSFELLQLQADILRKIEGAKVKPVRKRDTA